MKGAKDDDEDTVPFVGPHGREPRTQGERIRWVRYQIGPEVGTPMPRADFVELLARRSGEEVRTDTTLFRWEKDIGRGPTLKEGVAIARLVGRTAEWLSALDDFKAELEAQRQAARAERVTPKASRDVAAPKPEPGPVRKQGHGRGRRR